MSTSVERANWSDAGAYVGGRLIDFLYADPPFNTGRTLQTPGGALVVPTLDEMVGMKAYLAYARNTTRDFLDFGALAELAGDEATLAALLKSDDRYGHLQSGSVALAIAGRLMDPNPYDLKSVDLSVYKGLKPEWRDWSRVRQTCQRVGELFGDRLALDR